MAEIGNKYHESDTHYVEGEAEYDAADYNYQVVDLSGDTVVLCSNREDRDHILKLLNENPIPE